MGIEPRDPTLRYWVQSARPELEGRLGTTFSLSNGLLGLRGAHEECPSWGRPEFYVAGTPTTGPASLLGVHDPDPILTHPERMPPEALAASAHDSIQTLPNLPFPIALWPEVDGRPFAFETHKVLSAERLLELHGAVVRRTLVFRDDAGRRTPLARRGRERRVRSGRRDVPARLALADTRHLKPETRHLTPETRHLTPET